MGHEMSESSDPELSLEPRWIERGVNTTTDAIVRGLRELEEGEYTPAELEAARVLDLARDSIRGIDLSIAADDSTLPPELVELGARIHQQFPSRAERLDYLTRLSDAQRALQDREAVNAELLDGFSEPQAVARVVANRWDEVMRKARIHERLSAMHDDPEL